MQLRVRLGSGFRNHAVRVRADGRQVFEQAGVSTDLRKSVAARVDVPVSGPVMRLDVSVAGGPDASLDVRPQETPFVEVRFLDGKLDMRASAEEAPML